MYKLNTFLLTLTTGLVLGWFAHVFYINKATHPLASNETSAITASPQPGQAAIDVKTDNESAAEQIDSVIQLLQRNAYLEAVERYEFLQTLTDRRLMHQARAQILNHAQKLVKTQNFIAAIQLLQRFLVASYRDSDARMLLAEAYIGQEDYLTAIEQLYEVSGIAYQPQMLARVTQRIHLVVYKQAELYRKNGDNTGLLALFQNLAQKQPDHAAWFIELAIAQLALNDREAAQYSLALVTSDPDVGEQARTMLTKLEQTASASPTADASALTTDIVGIPLSRMGQNFLVEATPGNAHSLQLLIDTGASMTILTPDALQMQGIRYQVTGKKRVFNTANGTVDAPIYILESLTVGGWRVEQVEVGVLELNGVDGLLGMNYLRHFRFFIDQHASMLRLSQN